MSGARGDYIPTFVKASTPEGLRPLFFIVNFATSKVNDFDVMQSPDDKQWYAWFYATPGDFEQINIAMEELEAVNAD